MSRTFEGQGEVYPDCFGRGEYLTRKSKWTTGKFDRQGYKKVREWSMHGCMSIKLWGNFRWSSLAKLWSPPHAHFDLLNLDRICIPVRGRFFRIQVFLDITKVKNKIIIIKIKIKIKKQTISETFVPNLKRSGLVIIQEGDKIWSCNLVGKAKFGHFGI